MEYLIRKTECQRLKTIFDNIIPSIENGLIKRDVRNIEEVLEIALPKLRDRALELSSRCIKDSGCDAECPYCDPVYINVFFNDAINKVNTNAPR